MSQFIFEMLCLFVNFMFGIGDNSRTFYENANILLHCKII